MHIAEMRAQRRQRRESREAELNRQDREAARKLANLTPAPSFSEMVADGQCPDCGGRQFRQMETAGEAAMRGFLAAGLAGVAVAASQGFMECVTCGKIFRKG
jgi:hypothetical protein